MRQYRQRLSLRDWLCVLFITLGILPGVFPMVTLKIKELVLSNAAFYVWLSYVVFMDKNKPNGFLSWKNIWPLFFPLFLYIISFVCRNVVFGNRMMSMSILYFGYIIYEYYKKTERLHIVKKALTLLVPFIIYTAVKTAIALTTNPWISRSIKNSVISASTLRQGVSGYSLIYMLAMLVPVLFFAFMREKKIMIKITLIVSIVFCFYTIVISNYFTALIVIFVSVFAFFIAYHIEHKNVMVVIMLSVAMLLILTFWVTLRDNIIDYLISLSPNGQTANRLNSMRNSMAGGVNDEFNSDRAPIMWKSMSAAFTHPFFGVSVINSAKENPWKYIGNHSYILDNFAIWGLILGYFNMIILFKPFHGRFKEGSLSFSMAMLISVIIIMGFDNATNSLMLIVCIVYPYICDHYSGALKG